MTDRMAFLCHPAQMPDYPKRDRTQPVRFEPDDVSLEDDDDDVSSDDNSADDITTDESTSTADTEEVDEDYEDDSDLDIDALRAENEELCIELRDTKRMLALFQHDNETLRQKVAMLIRPSKRQ